MTHTKVGLYVCFVETRQEITKNKGEIDLPV